MFYGFWRGASPVMQLDKSGRWDSSFLHYIKVKIWRGARVVEWGALEKRCARKGTEGSNPSFSARKFQINLNIIRKN